MEAIVAAVGTVNCMLLLLRPPIVTRTGPVEAPVGTEAVILVSLQLVAEAATLLNKTVLLPWVVPKPLPVIVTAVPIDPEVGDKPEITAPPTVIAAELTCMEGVLPL